MSAWNKTRKRIARIINRKADWIFVTDCEDGREFLAMLQRAFVGVLGAAAVFTAEIDYANQHTARAMKVWWLSTPKERTPRSVLNLLSLLFGGVQLDFQREDQDVFYIGGDPAEVLGMVESIAKGKVWDGRRTVSSN